jgi:hypothetical protein
VEMEEGAVGVRCAPSSRMCRAHCCLGRARRRLGCAHHCMGVRAVVWGVRAVIWDARHRLGRVRLGRRGLALAFEYLAGGGATHLRRRAHSSTLCLPSILLPLVCVHRRSIGCTWR